MSMTFGKNQINTLDYNYVATGIGINREIVYLDINNAQMLQNWIWGCISVFLKINDSIVAFLIITVLPKLLSTVGMCQLHDIPFHPLCTPFSCVTELNFPSYIKIMNSRVCHGLAMIWVNKDYKNHKFRLHTSLILCRCHNIINFAIRYIDRRRKHIWNIAKQIISMFIF